MPVAAATAASSAAGRVDPCRSRARELLDGQTSPDVGDTF